MAKIIVETSDKYLMDVSNNELRDLRDGNVDITELLESKRNSDELIWKNGNTDWYE